MSPSSDSTLKWPLPKLANLGPGRQCDAFHRQKQGFVWDDIDYNYQMIWVWINTYTYHFSGMNIHLPAILGFTRYQGFDPSHIV